jgi:hypothetical protein
MARKFFRDENIYQVRIEVPGVASLSLRSEAHMESFFFFFVICPAAEASRTKIKDMLISSAFI